MSINRRRYNILQGALKTPKRLYHSTYKRDNVALTEEQRRRPLTMGEQAEKELRSRQSLCHKMYRDYNYD